MMTMRFIKFMQSIVMGLIFIGTIGVSDRAWSSDLLGAIDKNETYDIFYGGEQDSSGLIIKRVKLVRIDEINGAAFLVFISDSGFNAKTKEGFVLFSTIKSIIPNNTFMISGESRFKPR